MNLSRSFFEKMTLSSSSLNGFGGIDVVLKGNGSLCLKKSRSWRGKNWGATVGSVPILLSLYGTHYCSYLDNVQVWDGGVKMPWVEKNVLLLLMTFTGLYDFLSENLYRHLSDAVLLSNLVIWLVCACWRLGNYNWNFVARSYFADQPDLNL